jgi:hypothetical protein
MQGGANHNYEAAKRRRRQFLEGLEAEGTVNGGLKAAGISMTAYRQWRARWPDFANEVDMLKAKAKIGREETVRKEFGTAIDFAQFRLEMFDHHSPPFHLEVIKELETMAPGQILLVLFAPLHGKTTLFEDYAGMRLAMDPSWMATVGMNKVDHAKKVLGRIKARMEPDSGFSRYLAKYGPFRLTGPGANKQIWSASYFNVAQKPKGSDRDYSIQAVGMTASLASIRTNHLHGDDLQDAQTAGQTSEIERKFRQDWLSRPADEGRTTVFGNRVTDDDVYWRLSSDKDLTAPRSGGRPPLMRVIKMPCVVRGHQGNLEPLWPGRWTMEALEDMKAKVGDDAWYRNWMQQPEMVSRNRHFTTADIGPCLNSQRKLEPLPGIVWIGLDPAIGGRNAVIACEVSNGIKVTGMREAEGLQTNEEIIEQVEMELMSQTAQGALVSRIIIEAKNFQAGLARDERLTKLADAYHCELYEHLTGINKWDEDIGVLSMLHTFKSREFDLPWHPDDHYTRDMVQELINQFYSFRTNADEMRGNLKFRGNRLRQDLVMALWFVWIHWRLNTKVPFRSPNGWHTGASMFSYQKPNLIIPVGARP